MKLLQEQIISHSWPLAVTIPVFLVTPLEVSVTLTCAHEGGKMSCTLWMGRRGSLQHALWSCLQNDCMVQSFGCFLLQAKSFSLPPSLPLSSCFVSLSFPLPFAFQPGMCSTCLCNLHKLASEICAFTRVYCSVRVSWLFRGNS